MTLHIFSVDKEKWKCSSLCSTYLRNGRFRGSNFARMGIVSKKNMERVPFIVPSRDAFGNGTRGCSIAVLHIKLS